MVVGWLRALLCQLAAIALLSGLCVAADVTEIIQRSVKAIQRDFEAAPNYNYKETDRTGTQTKTYQVTMIDGSPYNRLIEQNGHAISGQQEQDEQRKFEQAKSGRGSESASDRQRRINKYQQDRRRDNKMMQQLAVAFTFKLTGEHKLNGFDVYVLRATPKPGYQPPNMETQVLPGMNGELWIDEKSFDWVKVTAKVIKPVSIEGFLAEVEPGTRFELEKRPVGDGIWMPSHFAMNSHAKVLFLFNHDSQQNQTFFDYQRIH
ncbi:MAG: hypothetical protein WA324_17345 [Bryobacteraceae bacterium]